MRSHRRKRRAKKSHIGQALFDLIRIIVTVALITGLIIFGLKVYREGKISRWNGKDEINVVINTNPILLVNLEPATNTLSLLTIPSDTYIEVPGGYGSYRAGSLYQLDEMENKNGELFMESISQFAGVPVDGWIGIKDGETKVLTDQDIKNEVSRIASLKTAINAIQFFKWRDKNLNSNFSFIDFAVAWWELRKVRPDKITLKNLADGDVLSELILPDGSKAQTADLLRLDAIVQSLFLDEKMRDENYKIEVRNGTDVPGIGAKVGRMVQNSGGSLSSIGNADERDIIKTRIVTIGQGVKDSYTAKRLSKSLKCDIKEDIKQPERADIVIIIGLDYTKARN